MDSTAGQEMLAILPDYYDHDNTRAILDAQGKALDVYKALLLLVIDQLFIVTASGWGLDRWEKELSLPIIIGKPDADRRSRILSKLRGVGTVTINLIKSIAEAYDNGTVDIIEHPEDSYFIVKFIDPRGIPPNLADVEAAVEEAKPAHLAVEYQFTYTTWGEIKATTWGTIKTGTWGELRTRLII